MIEFFTKLFTPILVTLGLISAPMELPEQPQITAQQEIIQLKQRIQELEFEKEIEGVEKQEEGEEEPETSKQKITYKVPVAVKPIIEKPAIEETTQEPICGVDSESKLSEIPEDERCSVGEASNLIENEETFTWACINKELSVNCSTKRKVNGECAYTRSTPVPVEYEKEDLCKNGESINRDYDGDNIEWRCKGINGGESIGCSSVRSSDAKCFGYIDCTGGAVTDLQEGGGKVIWTCSGVGEGLSESCSATLIN